MSTSQEPMDLLFHKGIATSVWQSSGGENSNWGDFAKRSKFGGLVPNIEDRSKIGTSTGFWDRYEEDIELVAKLGANSFRFSFEWHRIEPEQGVTDLQALKRYHRMLDVMERHKLTPNATMHHFVHPLWFEKLGGFENPDSIDLFLKYAKVLFENFGDRIVFWSTFNEPTCAMFCGWMVGFHPPGKSFAMKDAGTVLKHKLLSHSRAYHMIKAMPNGSLSRIGIVQHHTWFVPAGDGMLYGHVRWASYWSTYFWGRDVVCEYFKTGRFEWKIPLWGTVLSHVERDAPASLDWMGVNYYTRGVATLFLQSHSKPTDIPTDMGYNMHGPGMYEALKFWSVLGKPIYITETGCADAKDTFRRLFIRSYFDNMIKAVREGVDVRGFYYWTLVDNFEWNKGFSMKFGLYEWTQGQEDKRTLREGSRALIQLYKVWPSPLADFQAAAKLAKDSDLLLEPTANDILPERVPLDEQESASQPLIQPT